MNDNDNLMRSLRGKLDKARDAIDKAANYLSSNDAYKFEECVYLCNVHLRHVLDMSTEWADRVKMANS